MSFVATYPSLIQGGMGIGVSNWRLAGAVSSLGHLGVVSGTALDNLFIRRLADGDPGEHMRRAMEAFPFPDVVEKVLEKFFQEEGRSDAEAYPLLPMYRQMVSRFRNQVTVLANFVEVTLAKEGHDGEVGINLLTKVQMPNLPSLYGAMMAGVDYVLMGAGIPKEIPGALDRLAENVRATLRLDVADDSSDRIEYLEFEPEEHFPAPPPSLKRPRFLPIISSNSLATMLARKASGKVDGFIVEGPTAGGHNAPPRGGGTVNERGEPQYGPRDAVDLEKLAGLGLPFWLAGGTGRPGEIERARAAGAEGIQVGTLFAFCNESGISEENKRDVIRRAARKELDVITDGRASPTGFPFKVVQLEGTLSDRETYEARKRVCDLGYLRTAYRKDCGRLDYRCAAEPVETFEKKGGSAEEAKGRKCLCNALMADVGRPQVRKWGAVEESLLTSGDGLLELGEFLNGRSEYSARDVVDYLVPAAVAALPGEGGTIAAD
jgi:nitronate monooxygenase